MLFLKSYKHSIERSKILPKMAISVVLRPHALRPPTTLPLEDHNYTMDRAFDLLFATFYGLYHVVWITKWLNDF